MKRLQYAAVLAVAIPLGAVLDTAAWLAERPGEAKRPDPAFPKPYDGHPDNRAGKRARKHGRSPTLTGGLT